jgi:hypothetical protein
MMEYSTVMTASGATYSTVKLIMSNTFELYFRRCGVHIVSDRPFDKFMVIVPTQMKRGEEYRALANHTTTITVCDRSFRKPNKAIQRSVTFYFK